MTSFPEPKNLRGYGLLHEGALALSKVQENGIMVDREYIQRKINFLKNRLIPRLEDELEGTSEIQYWRKKYLNKTNFESGTQLGKVLLELGYDVPTTAKGNPRTDAETLKNLNIPIVDKLLRVRRLKKAQNTYLNNFLLESLKDGILHPFFDLHKVISFRSSSSNINFQNVPTRISEIKKLIRGAIIPRKGRHIVEVDYSGVEVIVAACYHKDPVMLEYLADKTKDMHRDVTIDAYLFDPKEVTQAFNDKVMWDRLKNARGMGKNKFTFPQFYGDYFVNCAKGLWYAIIQLDLKTPAGVPIMEHLATSAYVRNKLAELDRHFGRKPIPRNITTYEEFEAHIKDIETIFWQERFKVYAKWKQTHLKEYQKNGYVTSLTGFVYQGVMKKNEVINYPVQGAAFHCLLWSLIHVQKFLEIHNLKSMIIGQIHDSIILDVPPEELDLILFSLNKIMTKDIYKVWDWILPKLEIEADVTPVDGPWRDKEGVKIPTRIGELI